MLVKGEKFFKGNVTLGSVFLNLHVYFDPKYLFHQISVIKMRNVIIRAIGHTFTIAIKRFIKPKSIQTI